MATSEKELRIRAPDDFHVHFRDGDMMESVVPYTASHFRRALVMPNLHPPVRKAADALAYRERILSVLPADVKFTPLMTLYLTDATTVQDIADAKEAGCIPACKLYPAGATTNSEQGVTAIENISAVLATMQENELVLCIHGEVVDQSIDVFDREAEFVRQVLPSLMHKYPTLKIVLEHITSKEAAEFVMSSPGDRLAASITPHHLLFSRSAMFSGAKIHPHMYCLPVLKRESHRQALLKAIREDHKGVLFAGTDSAPHSSTAKECSNGCAGIFAAPVAIQSYAEAFEEAGALDQLQAFLSENAARFYGLPVNSGFISVRRCDASKNSSCNLVPDKIAIKGASNECVVPLRAGEYLSWSVENSL